VSGELYREDDKLEEVKQLVAAQQEYIVGLIAAHKAEIEEKIQAKARTFSSKAIEKQFSVNAGFKDLAEKVVSALHAGEVQVAKELANELVEDLGKHEEDLIIADSSPHGWLAVAKVRSSTDLPKNLRKRLAQVEKDLDARRPKDGRLQRTTFRFQGKGREPLTRRPDRKFSPEELLHQATKQSRTGTCSHCHKGMHFFRECPDLWKKVLESREAAQKADQSG